MLQPEWRQNACNGWPLIRANPEPGDSWELVHCGGFNGVFLMVIALSWWLRGFGGDLESSADVVEAIVDVRWVLSRIVKDRGSSDNIHEPAAGVKCKQAETDSAALHCAKQIRC